MRLYIAGAYVARDVIRKHVLHQIPNTEHLVNASWLYGTRAITPETVGPSRGSSTESVVQHTRMDFAEILQADAVLLLTESYMRTLPGLALVDAELFTTGGRHVECGYALAQNIPVVTVGAAENVFQRGMTHCTPDLRRALAVLRGLKTPR